MTTAKKAAAAKKTAASAPAAKADAQTTDTTETTTTPADGSAEAAPLDAPTGDADGSQDDSQDDGGEQGDGADGGSTAARSNSVESGPQTGAAAPAENTARPPATIVNDTPGAAPLDPPADHHLTRQPKDGYKTSSTDQTYAEVGGQTIAGENFVGLVDSDGDPVDVSTLFHRESDRATHVVATKRVSEVFTTPNAKTPSKRLIFAEGARVPLAQALRIEAAAKADAEAAAASQSE